MTNTGAMTSQSLQYSTTWIQIREKAPMWLPNIQRFWPKFSLCLKKPVTIIRGILSFRIDMPVTTGPISEVAYWMFSSIGHPDWISLEVNLPAS